MWMTFRGRFEKGRVARAAVIPGVCRQPGDGHVDPSHSREAYAGFEALPD